VETSFHHAEDGLIEVPDVSAVPDLRDDVPAGLVSSYVSLPLRREEALIGLLTIGYTRRTGRFSRRQLALARGLAHHAVAALENARLVRSLRDVNLVQRDFVAAVSHDLRTPLHILIGYNDMLLEGAAGDLTPAQRELVGRVRECCGRFLDLIEDILEVARLDAGHDRRQAGPLDLCELCRTLAREVEELRQPGVALRWTATPGTVETDGPKVKMILRNLVTNALKFTIEGHVEMAAVVAEDGRLTLRVADTGPGIRPEEATRIFQMFHQGSAGRRAGGSGLGLYLVKRLAEVLGGAATLVSGDPRNTVFSVTLPASPRGPRGQLEPAA
jgi:signal transduction histidine kinase